MNKTILNSTIAGILLIGSLVHAKPLPAELVMGKDRSWKGQIISRDGDKIKFKKDSSASPIDLGVNSVKEINFVVKISGDKISELVDQREFQKVIDALTKALEPFAEYSDIPSNLARYRAVLMELYYLTKQYDKSLAISEEIAADDRNPELQTKARVYRTLTLIDSGKSEEAKTLLSAYGWDKESSADAAPEELYIKAKLMVLNGEYRKAMSEAAKVIVFHSQDPDWIQPAELLCAEIYTELGMYDSADEVCRQIMVLYKDTPECDQAKELVVKIEKLRAEQKVDESLKSEEA